jgi:nicotinate phosphoribosyltransferase
MKLVEVNGRPVAKISDTKDKTMCENEGYINYIRSVFGIKN